MQHKCLVLEVKNQEQQQILKSLQDKNTFNIMIYLCKLCVYLCILSTLLRKFSSEKNIVDILSCRCFKPNFKHSFQ